MTPFELDLLAAAKRYQRWLFETVEPFLGQRILEIGSGIGNMSQHLPIREKLILTDIDSNLIATLNSKFPPNKNLRIQLVQPGQKLSESFRDEKIDTVVSFNVLEHINDDARFTNDILRLLRESKTDQPKRFISVVPAHQFAFGEIDKQFGHFRRYSDKTFRKMLKDAGAGEVNSKNYHSRYINLPGLLAWWLNGKVRKKNQIGRENMTLFEKICPIVRPIDTFLLSKLRIPFGNSLCAVYEVQS